MPTRYALVFAGQSLGGDGWAKNASRVAGVNIEEEHHFIAPTQAGLDYTLTTPLLTLADDVNELTIVSGLAIPWNASSSLPEDVPPGGAFRQFHGGVKSPLLCGMRSLSGAYACNGPTSDQIVAQLHPARVLVSAMQAAGWDGDTLSEVTGNVPELFA